MNTFELVIVIAAGLLTVFNLLDKLIAYGKKIKEPTDNLEERVSIIEKRMEIEYKALFAEYDLRFKKDLQRIEMLEEGNKVTTKALLALLGHAINGDNTDEMLAVKKELTDYIIKK
jgi:hypothetical protein